MDKYDNTNYEFIKEIVGQNKFKYIVQKVVDAEIYRIIKYRFTAPSAWSLYCYYIMDYNKYSNFDFI